MGFINYDIKPISEINILKRKLVRVEDKRIDNNSFKDILNKKHCTIIEKF